MRIFSKNTLRDFWIKYPDSKVQLSAWNDIMKKVNFNSPNEIISLFGTADIIKEGKIIFNVCGNKYRLIAKFNYEKQMIFILFIGTHKDYDLLNVSQL